MLQDLENDDLILNCSLPRAAEDRRLNTSPTSDAAAGGAPALRRRLRPLQSEVIRRLETAALQHNIGEFSRILGSASAWHQR